MKIISVEVIDCKKYVPPIVLFTVWLFFPYFFCKIFFISSTCITNSNYTLLHMVIYIIVISKKGKPYWHIWWKHIILSDELQNVRKACVTASDLCFCSPPVFSLSQRQSLVPQKQRCTFNCDFPSARLAGRYLAEFAGAVCVFNVTYIAKAGCCSSPSYSWRKHSVRPPVMSSLLYGGFPFVLIGFSSLSLCSHWLEWKSNCAAQQASTTVKPVTTIDLKSRTQFRKWTGAKSRACIFKPITNKQNFEKLQWRESYEIWNKRISM